jgi:hypothetical protein
MDDALSRKWPKRYVVRDGQWFYTNVVEFILGMERIGLEMVEKFEDFSMRIPSPAWKPTTSSICCSWSPSWPRSTGR